MRKLQKLLIILLALMLTSTEVMAATQTVIQTGEVKTINLNSTNVANGQLSAAVFGRTVTNYIVPTQQYTGTGLSISSSALHYNQYDVYHAATLVPGQTYTLSLDATLASGTSKVFSSIVLGGIAGGDAWACRLYPNYFTVTSIGTNKQHWIYTFTIASNAINLLPCLKFITEAGANCNAVINNVMLTDGNYKGEFISDTKSILSTRVKSVGKNLIDPNNLEVGGMDYPTGTNQDGGVYDQFVRMKNPIMVEPNTTYYVNNDLRVTTFFNINKNPISYYIGQGAGTITTPSNCCYMKCRSYNSASLQSFQSSLQIERGSSFSSYESFKESSLYLPNNITLNNAGSIEDEVNAATGEYIKRVEDASAALKNATGWTRAYLLTNTVVFQKVGFLNPVSTGTPTVAGNAKLVIGGITFTNASHTIVNNTDAINTFSVDGGILTIRVSKSYADSASFQNYLSTNTVSLIYQLATPVLTTGLPWAELSSKQTWAISSDNIGYKTIKTGSVNNADHKNIVGKRFDGEIIDNNSALKSSNQLYFNPSDSYYLYTTLDDADTGFLDSWTSSTAFTGMSWDGLIKAYMNGWKLITPDTNAANCVWYGLASGKTQTGATGYNYVTSTKDTGFTYNKLIHQFEGVALAGTYNADSASYNQDIAKQQNDYIEYYKNSKAKVNFNWYHNPYNWSEDYLEETEAARAVLGGKVIFDDNYPARASSTAIIEGLDNSNNLVGQAAATISSDGKSISVTQITGAEKYRIRYMLKEKKTYEIAKLTNDGTGAGIDTLSTKNAMVNISGSNITVTVTLSKPANGSEQLKLYTDSFEVINGTLFKNNRTAVFTTTVTAYPGLSNSTYFSSKRWTCRYTKAKTSEVYNNIVNDGLSCSTGANTLYVENMSGASRPNATVVLHLPDAPTAIAQSGLQVDKTYNRAGQVKIKWIPVSGAEKYRIYRKEAKNDLSIEAGGLSTSTGQPVVNAAKMRSQKYIKINRNKGYVLANDKGYTSANIMYYDSAYQLISYAPVNFSTFTSPDQPNIRYAKFEVTGTDTTTSIALFETADSAYRSISSTTNSYYVDNTMRISTYRYKVVAIKAKEESALSTAPEITAHKAGLAKPTANYAPGTYSKPIYVELKGYRGKAIEYQINGGTWKDYTGKIKVASTATITARIKGEPSTQTSYVYTIGAYTLPLSFSIASATWNAAAEEVVVTWAGVAGALKYDIYRSTAENGTYAKLNAAYLTGTTFTDSTVQTGSSRNYYYKVRAYNSTGKSVLSTSKVCIVP